MPLRGVQSDTLDRQINKVVQWNLKKLGHCPELPWLVYGPVWRLCRLNLLLTTHPHLQLRSSFTITAHTYIVCYLNFQAWFSLSVIIKVWPFRSVLLFYWLGWSPYHSFGHQISLLPLCVYVYNSLSVWFYTCKFSQDCVNTMYIIYITVEVMWKCNLSASKCKICWHLSFINLPEFNNFYMMNTLTFV